jgi:hypothetical protein
MRVVGVPMGDADPVQPGAEIALHLDRPVACKSPEVGNLGGILRGDDETEMMPVVEAASREGHGVGAVLGGAEHAALLTVPGDAVALDVGDVGPAAARAEGAPSMAHHPGLDDDTTLGGNRRLRLNAVRPRPNAERPPCGPPLLPVVEPGSTPACLLARRTSLMKISRRPRLPMDPIRILNSLSSLLTGFSGIAVWLVSKRALRNQAFCLRVALPTDRRHAGS